MQRANRAQRAAVGGKITPLTRQRPDPTRFQSKSIDGLRKTYGKHLKAVRKPDAHTGHITLVMDTMMGDTYWILDTRGQVIRKYEPLSLFPGADDVS